MICKNCNIDSKHCARSLCCKCYNSVRSKEDRAKPFTCPKCKKDKPKGSRGMCESCYAVWRYHQDPKKFLAIDKARWAKRRDKENDRRKNNYRKNKVSHLAKAKIWRAANYESVIEQQKGYRAKNIEYIRERNRQYNKTRRDHAKEMKRLRAWVNKQPKEKIRAIWVRQVNRRVARIKNLPNTLTLKEWIDIKRKYGSRCVYCYQKFRNLTQDHIVPVIRGGGYTADNIVPACRSCNSKKGSKTAKEFILSFTKK